MGLAVAYRAARIADELWPEPTYGAMVGPSTIMRTLFARLERIAASQATLLIEGETGTGKELVARAVHDRSSRADGPFITVDCGSMPQSVLEAELFGHAKGAFTDAHAARPGAIEAADGGTVFLDEIGELPLLMQSRLLRALEARAVKRIGENQYRPIDVRFIFATHRNLERLVQEGAFREDLFFRLAVLRVRVPPLRERREDLPALAERLLPPSQRHLLTPGLLQRLSGRSWWGNVRELRNVLERLAVLGPEHCLDAEAPDPAAETEALPDDPRTAQAGRPWFGVLPDEWALLSYRKFRAQAMRTLERAFLTQLLERHHGVVTAAAAEAEIDRTYLHRLMSRYGL